MYQFSLFGRFRVQHDNDFVDGFDARKVQELFSYLVTFRSRTHPREQVADVLWEGSPPASTRKNMRQTLWQLQSALHLASEELPIIVVDGEFLSLNPDAGICIDTVFFERAANETQDVSGYDLTEEQSARLTRAAELYRAHFLEGWYVDWCLHERERLHNIFLMLLDKLICYHEGRQEYETAIQFCNRALREEYVRECTHYQLMRLHYLRGDRTAALRQYERCKSTLEEVLGVQPSQGTLQLYDYICKDDATAVLMNTSQVVRPISGDGNLPEVLAHLVKVRLLLDGAQWQALQRFGQDTP